MLRGENKPAIMEIITDLNSIRAIPTVATIGSFDGVHRGHVAMIAEARAIAWAKRLPLMVVTFSRHPRLLFSPDTAPFLLSSTKEKTELLRQLGVDRCLFLQFDKEMAALSAQEFMQHILHEKAAVRTLAVGYDHHFGRPQPNEGIEQYKAYGRQMEIEVIQMTRYAPEGCKISSSRIRKALAVADIETATLLLGRHYSINGTVEHGAALGRQLGYPTANISLDEPMQLLPADGVYECIVHLHAKSYKGVINIGYKPTVESSRRTIEVFIIDFSGDIYGEAIKVEFVRHLRREQRFENTEQLRRQIMTDVQRVIENNQ